VLIAPPVPVAAGAWYCLSAYLERTALAGDVVLKLEWLDGSGTLVTYDYSTVTGTSANERRWHSHTAPAGATQVRASLGRRERRRRARVERPDRAAGRPNPLRGRRRRVSDRIYPIGDVVTIAAAFTDASGAPADPDAVSLTVVTPDGAETVIAQPDLSHPTVGTWQIGYAPAAAGEHYWRFDGTGANAAAVEGAFTVAPKLARPAAHGAYVSVPEFKAAPTYVALSNLIVGGTSGQQDAELANALVRATAMVVTACGQPLAAHSRTERSRRRVRGDGLLRLTLDHRPYRSLLAANSGRDWRNLAAADLASVWSEGDDDRGPTTLVLPAPGYCLGEVYVEITYVAGWPSTTLAATADAGSEIVAVADPAGILPGDELRMWEPGVEETVTVAATYQPGDTDVPLTEGTANAHNAGAAISAMPADVREAVVLLACSLLVRPAAGDRGSGGFGGAARPATTRKKTPDARATDLRGQALEMLAPYARVPL
jgi:hypothetical protein